MPAPTCLILFERLARTQPGTKIRFLACVHTYDPKTGKLILQDRYASATNHSISPAVINIDNILENLSHEMLEVGVWINVIGTIRANDSGAKEPKPSWWSKATASNFKKTPCPIVDATMIWSAGAIKLEEYRASVKAYQDALKAG